MGVWGDRGGGVYGKEVRRIKKGKPVRITGYEGKTLW